METKFKESDDILKGLVTARREEVVRLQKAQADHLKDLETRGQERIATLKKALPKDIITFLDNRDKANDEAAKSIKSHIEKAKTKLISSTWSPENETSVHPGLAGGHLVAPNSLGWFTPYYGLSLIHI